MAKSGAAFPSINGNFKNDSIKQRLPLMAIIGMLQYFFHSPVGGGGGLVRAGAVFLA